MNSIVTSEGDGTGRTMCEPRILFRSVSLPELADIWRTGAVVGGGNLFNIFDARPDVFFADRVDPRLIRQGEYIDRQITFALRDHAVSRACAYAEQAIEDHLLNILAEARRAGVPYTADTAAELRWDQRPLRQAIKRRGKKRRKHLHDMLAHLERLEQAANSASEAYDEQYRIAFEKRVAWLSLQPFTSAILITRPLGGGLLYTEEDGGCMHIEREYGFRPGSVLLEDLSEIILIRACQEVGRCHPSDLPTQLARLSPDGPIDLGHEPSFEIGRLASERGLGRQRAVGFDCMTLATCPQGGYVHV